MQKSSDLYPYLTKQIRTEQDCYQPIPAVTLPYFKKLLLMKEKSKRPFSIQYEDLLKRLEKEEKVCEQIDRLRKEMENGNLRCI